MSLRVVSAAAAAVALAAAASVSAAPRKDAGAPVLLAKQTRASGCLLAAVPDRRCSPGAYAKKLTQRVVCAESFRTSDYRNVSTATKHAVEVAYGMTPKSYGSTLEIDHIVSLELGGSNDPANLFPEQASPAPGYRVKDRLENRLHALVCKEHAMTLRQAQRRIAKDWRGLYERVFGAKP
jgi:hypothetical protein